MSMQRLGLVVGTLTIVLAACGNGSADTTTATTLALPPAAPVTTSTTTLPPSTTSSTEVPHAGATSTILVVQLDLTALGYFSGTIDGISGDETQAALVEFQTDAGLEPDGEFGPKTDAAMAPLLQADADYVTELQEVLVEMKFYGGPVDGDYGKGTVKGVKLLQKSCDLEETGELDIKTRLCAGGYI